MKKTTIFILFILLGISMGVSFATHTAAASEVSMKTEAGITFIDDSSNSDDNTESSDQSNSEDVDTSENTETSSSGSPKNESNENNNTSLLPQTGENMSYLSFIGILCLIVALFLNWMYQKRKKCN